MKWTASILHAGSSLSVTDSLIQLHSAGSKAVGWLRNVAGDAPTYPVLVAIEHFLDVCIGKPDVWYKDYKPYVGMLLWVGMWKRVMSARGGEEEFGIKFIFTLGVNLLVLVLVQQNGAWGLLTAGLGLALQSYLGFAIADSFPEQVLSEFSAGSMYCDLSRSLLQTTTVFMGQTCFVFCYVSYLFNNVDPTKLNLAFWFMAFIGLQMAAFFNRGADSLLGEPWDHETWYNLTQQADTSHFSYVHPKTGKTMGPFKRPRLIMQLRGIMGFVMNTVARDFVAFTIPIFLAHFSSPLDFVVYSIGVNFITTLDDMTPKLYSIELESDSEDPSLRKGMTRAYTDNGLW